MKKKCVCMCVCVSAGCTGGKVVSEVSREVGEVVLLWKVKGIR